MKTPVLIATPLRSWRSPAESLSPHLRKLLTDLAKLESPWVFDFTCYAGGNVARGRNKIVAYALRASYRYILFIDDDIEPTVQDVLRMLSHKLHVVGAFYTTREEKGVLVLNPFREAVTDDATGLLPVGEIGCGCKCYHRSVFEHLIKREPSLAYVSDEDANPEWGFFSMGVREVDGRSRWLSEDYWLDQLCRKHGVPVYADTLVRVIHRDQHTGIAYPIGGFPPIPKPRVAPTPPPLAEDVPWVECPGRLVIALQFWDGDKAKAMRLARFIADLEPEKREDVIFCFVPRFDCEPDPDTVDYVKQKFHVERHTGPRHVTGYPCSPNRMAVDMMKEAARRMRWTWQDVKAVLLFEADCVPLAQNWINELSYEWDRARAAKKLILGSWRPVCGDIGHINGNLLFHPQLTNKVTMEKCPDDVSWDTHYAAAFAPKWMRTGLIANRYNEILVSEDSLTKPECGTRAPVLVHGIKDDSAWDFAQKLLTHETSSLHLVI